MLRDQRLFFFPSVSICSFTHASVMCSTSCIKAQDLDTAPTSLFHFGKLITPISGVLEIHSFNNLSSSNDLKYDFSAPKKTLSALRSAPIPHKIIKKKKKSTSLCSVLNVFYCYRDLSLTESFFL